MTDEKLYKITFVNQDKVFEIYAKNVYQDGLYGFVEVEELIFGSNTTVVVDPAEERLKDEFDGVTKTFIPMHSIIRIDEVVKKGECKVIPISGKGGGAAAVSPIYTPRNTIET